VLTRVLGPSVISALETGISGLLGRDFVSCLIGARLSPNFKLLNFFAAVKLGVFARFKSASLGAILFLIGGLLLVELND